jgi:hypothetical protein
MNNNIYMGDINSVSLDITDLIQNKLGKLTETEEANLYDLVLDLLGEFYSWPDYRNYN